MIIYQLRYTLCFLIFVIPAGKDISTLVKINQSCQETKCGKFCCIVLGFDILIIGQEGLLLPLALGEGIGEQRRRDIFKIQVETCFY